MGRGARLATAFVVATVTGVGLASAAIGHGYDVSWPQCGRSLPVDGDFRVVGVNGGKPYEVNPCLRAQYQWAAQAPAAGFYINTANPGAASTAVDWYNQKSPTPACSRSDEAACAYNYGYNGAAHAFTAAQRETGAARSNSWWLDVETQNSWSSNQTLNVASIMGAIAFLRSQGVPAGVYSTDYQWRKITGGARLPDVPNWVAGARNAREAASWCTPESSFTGGPVILIQWVEHDLDHDHLCAPLPSVTAAPPAGPAGLDTILNDLLQLNLPKLLKDLGIG